MDARVVIDQALLGYDQGHRLLSASLKLPQNSLALLLGVSDTDVREGRRLAGVPLPDGEHYALVATWAAPEAGRPGAVWAHALLLSNSVFEETDVRAIAQLLARPDPEEPFSVYTKPLAVTAPLRRQAAPALEDVLTCGHALYASKNRVAHVERSDAAEAAILALWSSQWPALQARCSFAVRSARHRSLEPFDVVILTDKQAPAQRPRADDVWLAPLASELIEGGRPSITAWLTSFGPEEPPRTASVRALGRLWSSVVSNDVEDVVTRLAERYPAPEDHPVLKLALLGRERRWWKVPETRRLAGLVASTTDAWDVVGLELEQRVGEESTAGRWKTLVRALPVDAPGNLRDAFLAGLARDARPEMLAALARKDIQLAGDLLVQSDIGVEPEAWRGLDRDTVIALLRAGRADGRPRELAAALAAGHLTAVLQVAGVRTTLKAIGHVDAKTLTAIARDPTARDLVHGADPQEVLLLAAAGARVPVPQRVSALEALRSEVDARWLKLAVETLIDDPASLDVVFGPLHAAAVDGQLPTRSAKRLQAILPKGKDLPQRLRALLLEQARKQRWSRARLATAARGAGPQADRLLDELGPKDPLQKAVRWILSKAGVHV